MAEAAAVASDFATGVMFPGRYLQTWQWTREEKWEVLLGIRLLTSRVFIEDQQIS